MMVYPVFGIGDDDWNSGLVWFQQLGNREWDNIENTVFCFPPSQITADGDCSYEIKRRLLLGRKVMTNLDSIFKSRDITLPTKVRLVKASGHVWMWVLDCEESWMLKNWCFWTMVLEKTLESPLDCKEIQPVHSKGDWSWVFFGRTDAKAETPVLWPPHVKSWLVGKDWCWEGLGARGKGAYRGWDGWMASQTWWTWVWVNSGSWWWTGRPGVLQFMGSQRSDTTEWLNWTEYLVYAVLVKTQKYYRFWKPWVKKCVSICLIWIYLTHRKSSFPCPPPTHT